MIYLIPGFLIVLEAVLTAILIALIGAAGYAFFVSSMRDDRAEKRMELYYKNPWDELKKQSEEDEPKKPRIEKSTKIGIILLLAAVIVLLLLILLINYA